MSIKSVLREELRNSIKMKERYEEELHKLPKGSLIPKKINGGIYFYLEYRDRGKIKFDYVGKKNISDKEIKRWKEIKELRAKYRNNISVLKKQIKYLRGTLRGRKEI